jgi:hypothetical protein
MERVNPFPSFRQLILRMVALLITSCAVFATSIAAKEHTATLNFVEMFTERGQRFCCTVDFPEAQCRKELAVIRDLLSTYHGDHLGPWKWILVFSSDWKPLLQGLGLHVTSPGITSVLDRVTLLEESLFAASPRRATELLLEYKQPLEHLLERTLTHELGHAFCSAWEESLAEAAAREIRGGMRPHCGGDSLSMHASARITEGRFK